MSVESPAGVSAETGTSARSSPVSDEVQDNGSASVWARARGVLMAKNTKVSASETADQYDVRE